MNTFLRSAALLLTVFLFSFINNNVQAQCPLGITATMTPVTCFGGSDGTITVTGSGGVAPYDFAVVQVPLVFLNFTGNSLVHTFTGLPAGNYIVVFESDNSGCTPTQVSTTITVTQPAAGISTVMSFTPVSCNGGANGTATVTPSGGTPGYLYQWSASAGNQTTQTATGLTAGTHSVVVTDANGCTTSNSVTVTQPAGMTHSTVITNILCNGQSNGAIDLTVSGGTGPYTYLWSPGGQTTQDVTGLAAGTYSVLITDGNGCTLNVPNLVITQPLMLSSSETHVNVNCAGSNTGSINVSVSGGTSPYTYVWNTAQTTQDLSGLAPGFYSVTITDANGCTTTESATITQLSNLTASSFITDATCGVNNGAVNLTVAGGSGNYSYSWSPSGATTEDISGIGAAVHTVTVTDLTLGCTVVLGNNVQSTGNPDVTGTVSNASNCNATNGAIDITVTGGSGSYSYSWSPSGQVTQDRTNLAVGSYTVTVTDNTTGCVAIGTFAVANNNPITLSGATTNSNCSTNTGAIDLTVTGGTGPFTYSWSNGATTQDLSAIGGGIYSVTVTDANGCTASSAFPVSGSNGITVTSVETDILCAGDANGSINLTVSGGSGTYTYSWSNTATTQDISSLSPGTYTVSVTDAVTLCSSFLSFTITQPSGFAGFGDVTHVSCNGGSNGSIDITLGGATPPYTYLWTGGATTQDITGLSAGTYSVTATDANGCQVSGSFTVIQPAAIALSETHVNVSCSSGTNGSINLSVSGGSAPFTYGWSNGATTQDISGLAAGFYSVTATDANGCSGSLNVTITEVSNLTVNIVSVVNSQCNANTGSIDITVTGGSGNYTYSWSPGAFTSQDLTGLAPNTYTVTVTDVTLGCVQTQAINVSETGSPTVSGVVTPASNCVATNGAIDVTVSGGSGTYTYSWAPSGQITQDRTALAPGTYNVTVTDAVTGCSGITSFVVTAGSTMSLSASVTNSSCSTSTGAIDLSVSGGTAPYTYLWTNGATTQDISGLPGAIYGVTVTDANGCPANSFFTVSESAAFTLSVAITNINCAGGINGAINLTVSGGSGNYTYVWSNGATTQDLSVIPAGSYSVSVTDVNTGCTSFAIYTVTEPTTISINANVTNIPCNGSGTGSIDLTVSGGTPLYSYSWSNGATTQDLTGLAIGTYTLTFSDANGCGGVYSYTVSQPTSITITETHTNVTCNGLNDGAIDVSVSGGTAPYFYLWAPGGQTTQDRTALAPATYTVTVTDINGCNDNLSVTITQPAVLSATETHTNVTCFGSANGTIDVTITGGTGPYTYLWTPSGQTTQDRTGLAPGTYSVAITDANGCTTSVNNVVITQPLSALTVSISSSTNVTCFGLCNGTATVSASGGNGPYAYLWTPGGQTTQTAVNLCPNIYNVAVTDANGCTASATVTIIEPADLVASATGTDASCNSVCDGTAIATQSGGTSPFTYFWLPSGPATNTVNNLCAGTYQVVITDFNGCDDTASVTINEPAPITYTSSTTPVLCNGACNGTATVTPSGGIGSYTYAWNTSPVQTTQTATGLCVGVYTVTITDSQGCSTIATVAVPSNSALVINVTSNDPTCNGSCDGDISTSVSGGTGPYTYLWTPGGQTTPSISNLCAGTYTITVTDANGCQQVEVVTLTDPAPIVITPTTTPASCNGVCDAAASIAISGGTPTYSILWTVGGETTASLSNLCAGIYPVTVTDINGCQQTATVTVTEPPAINLSTNVNNISCNGNNDGSIDLVVTGGTPGYTYLWDNTQTTQDLSGLAPGTYSVTVTDANNCTATTSVTITEPGIVDMTYTSTPATCGACDGTATLTVTGGTAPYTYLWGTGATTATATNLCAGVYPVFVTDANGCTQSFAVAISNTGGPSTVTVATTDASCFGTCDGTATVTGVTGGASPYTYLWIPGGATTTSVSGLCAGTYFIQVSDTSNCTFTQTVTISEPSQIVGNEVIVTADCGLCNGSIALAPSGGQGPYTYLWGGGETTSSISALCAGVYTVDITDANGCVESLAFPVNNIPNSSITVATTPATCNGVCDGTATVTVTLGTAPFTYLWSDGQTDATATGLCGGVYTVQVNDFNNCIATDIVVINEPALLALSLPVVSNVTCNGACDGTIAIIASGGTLPYSYLWSDGQTTATATGLCPGTYNVTVTDANGCTTVWTDIAITEPTPIVLTTSWIDALCFSSCDGTATVTASGGTPGYTYLWTPGNQTGATATGLCAGTYIVQVTDANGCVQGTSVLIGQPIDITLVTDMLPASCNGVCDAEAWVVATGGTPSVISGYTYSWNPGLQTGDTATALCAGLYTVTVTDSLGCVKSGTVNVTEPAAITIAFAVNNVTCFSACDADITATPSGGTSPYTYQWTNTPDLETVNFADSLCPGTYVLVVTDANGCTGTDSATVTEPTLLVFNATVNNNVSCGGLCDGSATVTPSGGTPNYSYLWSPSGQTTATATNLCAGIYTVTVTDANGCDTTQTITITEPPILTLFPTTTNASCGGVCDGTATANIGGGTPPYDILWSDGQTTQTAVGLCAGNYSVLITDTNTCTITVNVIILEPPVLSSSITNFSEILCVGSCDAFAEVDVVGGVPPYNYQWDDSNNQTDSVAINLCVGTYNVLVTDAIGCTTTATIVIDDQNALATAIPLVNQVSCFGACDGNATAIATGGVAPYSFVWSNGQSAAMATNLCPGTYTVTVTDAANCVSTSTVTITEPALLTSAVTGVDASCGGVCDGTATAAPQGGTAPYGYLWVPGGQTTATATGLCAGTYTVTVTDANGCDTTATVVIDEPPILLASASVTAPTCTNTNNGAIDLTVTGGVAPYEFDWTNGSTTEDISNLLPGTYTVTVTDATDCFVTLAVAVIEQVVIDANAGQDITICIGETVQLQATGGSGYLWTPASGLNYNNIDNPVATITTTTTYVVQVTNFSCVDYDTITITVNPLPVITAGPGAAILSGTTIQLGASGAGINGTYSWSPTDGLDDPNIANPNATPLETTIYYVTGTDENGCSATDSLTIEVSPGIEFPDGITPNGDGKNDTWVIDFINNFPEAVVMVYNRWGQELFYSKGYGTPWDGKYKGNDLPVGTYYYVIDLHDGNNTPPYTGPITIAR